MACMLEPTLDTILCAGKRFLWFFLDVPSDYKYKALLRDTRYHSYYLYLLSHMSKRCSLGPVYRCRPLVR